MTQLNPAKLIIPWPELQSLTVMVTVILGPQFIGPITYSDSSSIDFCCVELLVTPDMCK